jgi:hypothetical protein
VQVWHQNDESENAACLYRQLARSVSEWEPQEGEGYYCMIRHSRNCEKGNANQKTGWPFLGSQAWEEVESVQPFSGPQEMESGVCKLLFIKAEVRECCVGVRLSCLWREPFMTCLGRTYPAGSYCRSASGSYISPFESWSLHLDSLGRILMFCSSKLYWGLLIK